MPVVCIKPRIKLSMQLAERRSLCSQNLILWVLLMKQLAAASALNKEGPVTDSYRGRKILKRKLYPLAGHYDDVRIVRRL